MLDLAGGFVDPGESLEQAAKREVSEELNIVIDLPKYVGSFSNRYKYKEVEYSVVDVFFLIELNEKPKIVPDDDVEDIIWQEIKNIKESEIAFESLKKALNFFKF